MTNPLLSGVRVLDLSRLLPGPFCTLYLAQLGAEVIKIEEPDGGDYTRKMSPELFELINRGKKSVTLDLRRPEDVAIFKRLVEQADVLVDSFRPGVMDRLGCGYDVLKAINPRLVYAALTGYGHTGPYRDRAGHDMNYRGYAGELEQSGASGGAPATGNFQVADLAGGALTCAIGILAAVIGARASGRGAFVDVGMLDGTLALMPVALSRLRAQGRTQPRGEDMLSGALPNYSLYKCRDGKYLAVGALEPKFFMAVLKGLLEVAPKPLQAPLRNALAGRKRARPQPAEENAAPKPDSISRFAEIFGNPSKARRMLAPVRWAMAAVFRLRTRDQWERLLVPHDACVSGVLKLEEVLENEQVLARGLVEMSGGKPAFRNPIRFVGAETRSGECPALGEHTGEVLAACGIGNDKPL
jgi:crotonobetainyl-CoA:carnitine CoA-transferase CaiB-like acyl-CoA transferase